MTKPIDRRLLLRGAMMAPAAALIAGTASRAMAAAPDTLTVIAELTAKPEKADEMRKLITDFAASARGETGCQHYTLMEDTKTPGAFYTYEIWTGPDALAAHMKTPAIADFAAKLKDILAKPPVQTMLKTLSTS